MGAPYNRFAGGSQDRLATLSDGVFAVAMTLLVLDLRVPVGVAHADRQLLHALSEIAPSLAAYLLSFTMLGTFWLAQHTLMSLTTGTDRTLTWLQLAFLFVVTLLPFSASLLAEYVTVPVVVAVGLYWLNLLLLGVTLAASSRYIARGGGRSDMFDSADLHTGTGQPPNHARYTFLDPRAGEFYPDWNRAAADSVSLLRAEAGRNPDDRILKELIGELTTRSERFAALWATHNVRWHTTGTKHFRHRVVGDLALAYEGLELPADAGQTLITFTAQPDSESHEALAFLASWATSEQSGSAPDQQRTPGARER